MPAKEFSKAEAIKLWQREKLQAQAKLEGLQVLVAKRVGVWEWRIQWQKGIGKVMQKR